LRGRLRRWWGGGCGEEAAARARNESGGVQPFI